MTQAQAITIENVVASTDAGQELDLQSVAMDLPNAEYDADNFPGLIYKTSDPRATALLFRSGKLVCTGASSPAAAREGVAMTFAQLRDLGIEAPTDPTITIQNIVSSADLGESLNLNAIAIGLGLEAVEYEPEQFPGLVYRLDDPDAVVLLFGSGKLVITGANQLTHAERALEEVSADLDDLGLVDDPTPVSG